MCFLVHMFPAFSKVLGVFVVCFSILIVLNLFAYHESFWFLLQLQVDGGFNQNLNSKTLSAPNLSTLDFPALALTDSQSGPQKYAGDDLQHSANPYRSSDKDNMLMFKSSSSLPSRGAIDFASAVRKMSSQDSGMWKYDRNGSADSTVGSSRSSHGSANTYSAATGRGVYANRVQTRGSARSAPVWLETGDAVGNILHLIKFIYSF